MNRPTCTLNANGQLLDLNPPRVMGILNVTPDSFYADSRTQTEAEIVRRAQQIVSEGGTFIDVGAYSSRPGAQHISFEEETERLRTALAAIRRTCPDAFLSVDTFRADVARMCVEEYGVAIINDISGGEMDQDMFPAVARLGVAYILMHMQGTPQTMQLRPHYENFIQEVFLFLAEKLKKLHDLGVCDVWIDPGFGFGKTLEQNYCLMNCLEEFHTFEAPLLAGVSRKSMIYNLLGGTPAEALNGTTALNTVALMKGASVLRVHDVKAAVDTVRIVEQLKNHAC